MQPTIQQHACKCFQQHYLKGGNSENNTNAHEGMEEQIKLFTYLGM